MLIVDQQKNIKLSRGDYAEICFNLSNPNGEEYILNSGDKVEFAVKASVSDETAVINKLLTNDGESFVVAVLEKEDTENLVFGKYYYDIRVIQADGRINTPMLKADFELLEVVGNGC